MQVNWEGNILSSNLFRAHKSPHFSLWTRFQAFWLIYSINNTHLYCHVTCSQKWTLKISLSLGDRKALLWMTENTEPLEPAEGSLRQAMVAFFTVESWLSVDTRQRHSKIQLLVPGHTYSKNKSKSLTLD